MARAGSWPAKLVITPKVELVTLVLGKPNSLMRTGTSGPQSDYVPGFVLWTRIRGDGKFKPQIRNANLGHLSRVCKLTKCKNG